METKKWKNKNFWHALKHSLEGIKMAFQQERNVKIQVVFAIVAIILGLIFQLSRMEWIALFLTIAIVLCAEFINTAIEKMLDLYTEEYNEKIKQVKDIASGAVLITAMAAGIIGCLLFLPKIMK